MTPNSRKTVTSAKMNVQLVGCILSTSFHTAKYLLINLTKHRHDLIGKYTIKGVMDVEWTRYLWKINQSLGGAKRQDTVAIFINDIYIGSCAEFEKYLSVEYGFAFNLWSLNYKQLVSTDVQDYYTNNKLTFVRMVFQVNNWEIGHIVFALFDKLVPKTCKYFKKLVRNKTEGYLNSRIHRIDINNGFIQAGRISNQTKFFKKENFLVSHDRRGVLSLAGRRTHFNGPEFIISFQPNPWMDNKYVAFGHAVEGEKTLKTIEKLSSARDIIPDQEIRIISCDVLPDCARPAQVDTGLDTFLRSILDETILKAVYVYVRPEPLHKTSITDRQFVKSIVRALAIKALDTINDSVPNKNEAANMISSPIKLKPAYYHPVGDYNRRRCSTGAAAGVGGTTTTSQNMTRRTDHRKTPSTTKSKRVSTLSNTTAAIDKYGIDLPANHKDYWKYKKIYDSIAAAHG